MSSRVLITTQDLGRAGELRSAFQEIGHDATLVTPDHELRAVDEAGLLVLSGTFTDQKVRDLVVAAAEAAVPTLGHLPSGATLSFETPLLAEFFDFATPAEDVVLIGHRTLERRRLQAATGIVGETDAMRESLERVVQIAPVDSTVLVTGESGTGKELVARGIHLLSPRRHKPFIAVNVAALSEHLLESELFGHEKGSFTGAIDSRKGFFELAEGGTIFLDEIGEMPTATQTKLLRVLEQQEFHRVGGQRTIRVDVRIIAATNQHLRHLVQTGAFRKDLYYRLNVLRIEMPALRSRRRDVPLLVRSFVEEMSRHHDRPFPGISAEAMEILTQCPWPGNVRELRNLIESMVVLAPNRVIGPSDIPPEVLSGGASTAVVSAPNVAMTDGAGVPGITPQLEFVFRTLVDLKVDLDDLRRDFDDYVSTKRSSRAARDVTLREVGLSNVGVVDVSARELGPYDPSSPEPSYRTRPADVMRSDGGAETFPRAVDPAGGEPLNREGGYSEETPVRGSDPGVVVYRSGMTMEDLEREAMIAALREVGGNRRKAAERLGIGERTLYRKLHKYGLEEER